MRWEFAHDSLLRLRRYINYLLTYLLNSCIHFNPLNRLRNKTDLAVDVCHVKLSFHDHDN